MTMLFAVLIAAFGQHSQYPRRSAIWKLALLLLGGTATSIMIGIVASRLDLPLWPQSNTLGFVAAIIVQMATTATLISSLSIMQTSQDTIGKLLAVLPLTTRKRFIALYAPQIVLALLMLIIVAWPIYSITNALGLSVWILIPSILLGSMSALGLVVGMSQWNAKIRIALQIAVAVAEYKLLHIVTNLDISIEDKLPSMVVIALLILGSSLLPLLAKSTLTTTSARRIKPFGMWLPAKWWYVKKTLRSRTGRLSLSCAFLFSLSVAVISHRMRLVVPDSLFVCAALIAASSASDMRSITTTIKPAEITNIRATMRFNYAQLSGALLVLLCTAPLMFEASIGLSVQRSLYGFLVIASGVAAGTLSGVGIAPEARDISAQFTAVLTSSALVWASGWFFLRLDWPIAFQIAGTLAIIGSLLSIACLIEYKRNFYIWRKKYAHFTAKKDQ